jgi:alginate O-acetyltransferase complex protein AlgJ
LFLAGDLRFLSVGQFWGEAAAKVSRAEKKENADPLPAILNFRDQLKQRGIELLVVPVPPKPAIYADKLVTAEHSAGETATGELEQFYADLKGHDVHVVDLAKTFLAAREGSGHGGMFCKTDTHWSGAGCLLAAQSIASEARQLMKELHGNAQFNAEWKQVEITGDLVGLLPNDTTKPPPEKIDIHSVVSKDSGQPVQADPHSPVLLLGDSHTLVYHDFHAHDAGLLDQLAEQFGFAPDLIGTRGSGATAVRTALYRRSHRDPNYLKTKKLVIWCFAAREFTEADGWAQLPIAPQ